MLRDEVSVQGGTYRVAGKAAQKKAGRNMTIYRLNRSGWYALKKDMMEVVEEGDLIEVFTVAMTARGFVNLLNSLSHSFTGLIFLLKFLLRGTYASSNPE